MGNNSWRLVKGGIIIMASLLNRDDIRWIDFGDESMNRHLNDKWENINHSDPCAVEKFLLGLDWVNIEIVYKAVNKGLPMEHVDMSK